MADFLGTVRGFQDAVRQHDEDAQERELDVLRAELGQAPDDDVSAAGFLLADVLNGVPRGRDALVADLIGGCVDRGANPADCAEPVLHRARLAFEGAADFCRRWQLVGLDFPERTGGSPPEELYEPLGGIEDAGARAAVLGWWTIPLWQSAVPAVLHEKDVRKVLLPRPELYESAREVLAASGSGALVARVLAVLDDEPLVVIDRASGQGFEFVMSGIADTHQLHILLAERLVTPGHLPGEPPSPAAVEACLGETTDAPCDYEGTAAFSLVAPDGSELADDGAPFDIPVVDGSRLLVLDPTAPDRHWSGVRAFPAMAAELKLTRRVSDDGVKRWMTYVSPAEHPYVPEPESAEHSKRHWWQRDEARQPASE